MLPTLDRHSPIPIYQQIIDWMREEIATGRWPEHYQLQSEIDLAHELGINRGTLRNAIQALIDEGLLIRIHGRGTFVSARVLEQPLAESLLTFSESLIDQNIPFETRVLTQRLTLPDPRTASLLSVNTDAPVFFLRRVRTVMGKPVILLNNYVANTYCPGIETSDFAKNRLFEVLENRFGLEIAWGRRTFEARVADAEVAAALQIQVGDPIMFVQQIVYLQDGAPLEMSDIWINSANFRVSAIVRRGRSNRSLSLTGGQPGYMHTEINF